MLVSLLVLVLEEELSRGEEEVLFEVPHPANRRSGIVHSKTNFEFIMSTF